MSEPTIKATFGPCPGDGRFRLIRAHAGNIVGFECRHCGACPTETISSPDDLVNVCPKRERHYTHDDLVRVAEASRQMAWVQVYNELKSPTIVFEETPSDVVGRLTGVKR